MNGRSCRKRGGARGGVAWHADPGDDRSAKRDDPLTFYCPLRYSRAELTARREIVLPPTLEANVAQLAEQVIRNDQVVGSNPTVGSIFIARRWVRPSAQFVIG